MSILGYSASYFLPEYWSNTPLYGEKIIPLIDYILGTDYVHADKLADAFYLISSKYTNTADLPIGAIEAIIEESGYSYVKDLLGNDEESIRLLVYLLVLIHQLKGTKLGIEVVLNLLKRDKTALARTVVGSPIIDKNRIATDFSTRDYIFYDGLSTDSELFELVFRVRTDSMRSEQCIASISEYGMCLSIEPGGTLTLSAGSDKTSWNIVNRAKSSNLLNGNTWYTIKVTFTGYEYSVDVKADGEKRYINYIVVPSNTPSNWHNKKVYLGVDHSSENILIPFKGYMDLSPFSIDIQNINISQWFEQFPVGAENTFLIKADLDINLISTDFFKNFAEFVRKYVYPSLEAFEVKLSLRSDLTFIPYARSKVTYIASGDVEPRSSLLVKTTQQSPEATDPYMVTINSDLEDFLVSNLEIVNYDMPNFKVISEDGIGTGNYIVINESGKGLLTFNTDEGASE